MLKKRESRKIESDISVEERLEQLPAVWKRLFQKAVVRLDMSALASLPALDVIEFDGAKVKDLSPLQHLRLKAIRCSGMPSSALAQIRRSHPDARSTHRSPTDFSNKHNKP